MVLGDIVNKFLTILNNLVLEQVGQLERRVREAQKLGFRKCVVPARVRRGKEATEGSHSEGEEGEMTEVIECANFRDAIIAALGIDLIEVRNE